MVRKTYYMEDGFPQEISPCGLNNLELVTYGGNNNEPIIAYKYTCGCLLFEKHFPSDYTDVCEFEVIVQRRCKKTKRS